jgi:hypothetical protein
VNHSNALWRIDAEYYVQTAADMERGGVETT